MATSSLPVAACLQAEGVKTMVTLSRHRASGDDARNLHPIRPGATILLVEDDSQVRQLTRGILQQYGYNVLTAESDSQAMWVWERHRSEIEMIIADMMIPNCTTGLDLARKLQEEKPQLRVLFTSGFSKEIGGDDTEYLRKAPFLQKPYTALSLMQSVISCFETEIRV